MRRVHNAGGPSRVDVGRVHEMNSCNAAGVRESRGYPGARTHKLMCWRAFRPENVDDRDATGMSFACNDNIEVQIEKASGTSSQPRRCVATRGQRDKLQNSTRPASHAERDCCRFGAEDRLWKEGNSATGSASIAPARER